MPVTHEEIMARIEHIEERCGNGCGRFGKKFPTTIIGAILLQTFAIVWWAADVSNEIDHMKTTAHLTVSEDQVKNFIADREKAYMEMDGKRHLDMTNRMTRVEENFKFITKSLERIESKLSGRTMD